METFVDIFKKSFLTGTTTQLSIMGVFIVMGLSLLVAIYIYNVYKFCYSGVIYSHNFNVTVALMTVISAMIVATISSNIVLSLGMVGALSIVRFRTAIKDPMDVIFLFWAVAAGISVGARIYPIIIIGNLCIGAIFYLLTKQKRNVKVFLLIINFSNDALFEVNKILSRFKFTLRSKINRNGMTEMTVEMHLKDENTYFVDKLSEITGVESASLVSYSGDFAQ